MKRILMFTALGGDGAVIVVVLLFSFFAVVTQDYAISVDPIKDNQYLLNTARVTVINTGKLPLTDVVVNGRIGTQKLSSISPGEKVLLSSPDKPPLQSVTVTDGLSITKAYRIPWKIPDMMGS